jgi:hypothetical protein
MATTVPTVNVTGPVAATADSRPVQPRLGVGHDEAPAPLEASGYVEEEYFVDGVSDAFDPDGVRIARDVAFTTRVLVRRPSDARTASGTAFLDPLHMINEMPASWSAADWIMAHGHTWVGVTVHNSSFGRSYDYVGGVGALQRADGDRYASLHLEEFERPARQVSYLGPSMTDSFALKWNMAMAHPQGHPIVAGVAELSKRGAFGGAAVARVYGCGVSQTANFWRLFLDHGWHERARDRDGGPLFDAYVLVVSPASLHRPADAVLVNVLSESEVVGTIVQVPATAPADSHAPRVRGIEFPGAGHSMGHPLTDGSDQGHVHTDQPFWVFMRAVFASLDAWVRDGLPMPHVSRIERDPTSVDGVARDEHGNAIGGLRVPWIEAPRAQYLPRCPCGPTTGQALPFSDEKLAALYPSDDAYRVRWDRAVTRLVEDRLLLPEDAGTLTPG